MASPCEQSWAARWKSLSKSVQGIFEFSNVQQSELWKLCESEREWKQEFTTDWRSKPGVTKVRCELTIQVARGKRQVSAPSHSSQTVNNVKIRRYACIAVDNLFTILSFARIVSAFEMNSIQRRRVTCYPERFETFQALQSLGEGQLRESWPSRWDMKTPTTRHGWLAIRSECEVVARAEPTISDGEPGLRRPRPRGKGKH
jgi:hypothetical protein